MDSAAFFSASRDDGFCAVIDVARQLILGKRTLTLSLSPHVCALHTIHTPRLSAFRKSREDETGVSLCPFARVYRRPVCGEVKHGKSYERGVDPLLPQPGLTEVLFVEVTNQTAPTPPPLPSPRRNPQ